MAKPIPVVVVSDTASWEQLIDVLILLALRAFVVMTFLPVFTDWHLSYWQSLAACITATSLLPVDARLWVRSKYRNDRMK